MWIVRKNRYDRDIDRDSNVELTVRDKASLLKRADHWRPNRLILDNPLNLQHHGDGQTWKQLESNDIETSSTENTLFASPTCKA